MTDTGRMSQEDARAMRERAEGMIRDWTLLGEQAAKVLFEGQWGADSPDWFDHRLHFLFPDKWLKANFFLCLARVLMRLPPGGKLLDLCSGDGFVDRWFYGPRAQRVLAVDRSVAALDHAQRVNGFPTVTYLHCDDLLEERVVKQMPTSEFDVVVMRGAIEHFKESDQPRVYGLARRAMRDGGWFVGDTCTDLRQGHFHAHEHVFQSAAELECSLKLEFSRVRVETYYEPSMPGGGDRTTFIWEAQA